MSIVKLINYTKEPEHLVAISARICYSKHSLAVIKKELTQEREKKLIQRLLSSKHLSPFEHVNFTFYISGISRSCLSQLTRHRIASYSVRSQRYINEHNFKVANLDKFKGSEKISKIFNEVVNDINKSYQQLIKLKVSKEDARSILPNCCCTQLVATFNARSLFNFFNLRLSTEAQDEIRNVANKMLVICKDKAPTIFSKYSTID